jgi:hypothetical protein
LSQRSNDELAIMPLEQTIAGILSLIMIREMESNRGIEYMASIGAATVSREQQSWIMSWQNRDLGAMATWLMIVESRSVQPDGKGWLDSRVELFQKDRVLTNIYYDDTNPSQPYAPSPSMHLRLRATSHLEPSKQLEELDGVSADVPSKYGSLGRIVFELYSDAI